MGSFQARASIERILFVVSSHENERRDIGAPFPLT